MRNSLESLTRTLRYKFGMKIAGEVKTNPKAFWRYANSKIKVKASIPTLADESLWRQHLMKIRKSFEQIFYQHVIDSFHQSRIEPK